MFRSKKAAPPEQITMRFDAKGTPFLDPSDTEALSRPQQSELLQFLTTRYEELSRARQRVTFPASWTDLNGIWNCEPVQQHDTDRYPWLRLQRVSLPEHRPTMLTGTPAPAWVGACLNWADQLVTTQKDASDVVLAEELLKLRRAVAEHPEEFLRGVLIAALQQYGSDELSTAKAAALKSVAVEHVRAMDHTRLRGIRNTR